MPTYREGVALHGEPEMTDVGCAGEGDGVADQHGVARPDGAQEEVVAVALRTDGGPVRAYGTGGASAWRGMWAPGLRLVYLRPARELHIRGFGEGTWCVCVAVLRGRVLHLDRTRLRWSRVPGERVPTVLRQALRCI